MISDLARRNDQLQIRLSSNSKSEFILFFSGLILINTLLAVWYSFDHAYPVYDMACHLLAGFNCRDLLAHAHPLHRAWWQALLAVNPLYPPLVYIIYGSFKLAFGPARWAELIVQHFFSSILFCSVYGLGKSIFNSRTIALLSALLIFSFPLVFLLTHYDMLDIPGLSMVSLSLFCFMYWQKRPSLLSSMLLGIACSCTALTKNNSVAFLIAPFAASLFIAFSRKDWHKTKYFLLVAITAVATILPWLVVGCRAMFKTVAMYQHSDYNSDFISNLAYYLSNLPAATSYLLFSIFILALFSAPKTVHRQMLFISASSIVGTLILSSFRWTTQIRYALPATIPIALYCAWLINTYFQKPKTRIFSLAIIFLVCFSFIQNNYTPYPLSRFMLPPAIATFLGIEPSRVDDHHAPGGTSSYPTPPSDWGYEWVFTAIKPSLAGINSAKENVKQFAIMPDSEEVSSTSYTYLARRYGLPLHPFTPRNFTLAGDEFSFRPDIATNIDWYLLKTGSANSPASHFCSKESEKAYKKWCHFVASSPLFELVGTKLLPDGTQLELYKKGQFDCDRK